ncbi:MAG: ABC transporter permease subunit [Chloroflexota bacterium]
MQKIYTIIRKEWAEVFKNRFVLFTVACMPLLYTAMPLIILSTGEGFGTIGDIPPELSAFCENAGGEACLQSFILSQFLMLYMIMPIIIPITIASYSIVGEKTTRTLEPVLATPISTVELLTGKAMAAVIPALLATWGSYVALYIGANIIIPGPTTSTLLTQPMWLLAIFAIGPLLSVAGVSIAVMVSSRANDPRVAEQLSALVNLPLMMLFIGQVSGYISLTQTTFLWLAAALFVIDVGLLYFAARIFQRETILTRWK